MRVFFVVQQWLCCLFRNERCLSIKLTKDSFWSFFGIFFFFWSPINNNNNNNNVRFDRFTYKRPDDAKSSDRRTGDRERCFFLFFFFAHKSYERNLMKI